MTVISGPNLYNTGLIFAYDMGNPERSWKGAPTTNLTPNLGISTVLGAPTVTYVGLEDGWKKYSLSGTWSGGTYPYSVAIDSVSFTGGVTYSSGVYIRTSVPAKFATLFTGMNYVNEPMNNAGTSFSTLQPDGSFFVGRSGFQYTSTTPQPGYILSQPVVGQTFSSATDFIFIKDGQVQTGSFPTPFTIGTRSNTQALLDLTGGRVITAVSLTYAANNTFSFNGSTDNLLIPTISLGNGNLPWTASAWVRTTTNATALGAGSVMSNQSGGPVYSMMGVNSGKIVYWTYQNSAWSQKLGVGPNVNDNVWHMLTWVNNSNNTMAMYVDGVLDSNVADSTSGNNNPIDMIGSSWSAKFPGSIGSVQVYNVALTADQVAQNFAAYRGKYGV